MQTYILSHKNICHHPNSTRPNPPLFKYTSYSLHISPTHTLTHTHTHTKQPPSMAEQHREQHQSTTDAIKSYLPDKGPSTSQVLAVVTLFPVGSFLLILAGLTLAGTIIGLTVATPLFAIFSPILVPAVLTIALAVAGFLTSSAFGITALSSISWLLNYVRRMRGSLPEQLEHARRRLGDTASHVGQKTREAGQKAQDVMRP